MAEPKKKPDFAEKIEELAKVCDRARLHEVAGRVRDLVPEALAWGQSEYEGGRTLGREQGVATAALKVEEHALYAFKHKKDDEARVLRDLALIVSKIVIS